MAAESHREQHPKHRRDADLPKPRDTSSQGIVRDQRGQEQPADKDRAQQTGGDE